jgi:hemolysin activation/secretion protein
LRRNCLLWQVIEGKIGRIGVTGRGERRRRKILDDLNDRRGYSPVAYPEFFFGGEFNKFS